MVSLFFQRENPAILCCHKNPKNKRIAEVLRQRKRLTTELQ